MFRIRSMALAPLLAVVAIGLVALSSPSFAGKGGGKGKGGPPGGGGGDCPCEETIEISPGVFCTLESCVEYVPGGYECSYVCPYS